MVELFRNSVRKIYWILSAQIGIDPVKILHFFSGGMHYIHDLFCFSRSYKGLLRLMPCLHDWKEEGGTTKSEYFWQDLLVARMIFEAKPQKHVDIGSRVDGFVAHVASFREIEVFDVRPTSSQIPGVILKQADLMKPLEGFHGYCDSLSCLHALEHFGLGRYGDPIDPEGFKRGFSNMVALLKSDGIFYLSVPIGMPRVEFNAHRIFDPCVIMALAKHNSLSLSAFSVIRKAGMIATLTLSEAQITELAAQQYSLGIFTFKKS